MPYIKDEDRKEPDMVRVTRAIARAVESGTIKDKGDMNYVFFFMARRFMEKFGYRYGVISDVKAAARDSADEVERRFMTPREDVAIKENGDVS